MKTAAEILASLQPPYFVGELSDDDVAVLVKHIEALQTALEKSVPLGVAVTLGVQEVSRAEAAEAELESLRAEVQLEKDWNVRAADELDILRAEVEADRRATVAEAKVAELQALVDCATSFNLGGGVYIRPCSTGGYYVEWGTRWDEREGTETDLPSAIARARELAEKGRAK